MNLSSELKISHGHVEQLNEWICFFQSVKEKNEHEPTMSSTQISISEDQTTKRDKKWKNNQLEIRELHATAILCQIKKEKSTLLVECEKHIREYKVVEERVSELERTIHIQQPEKISLMNNLSSEMIFKKDLKV